MQTLYNVESAKLKMNENVFEKAMKTKYWILAKISNCGRKCAVPPLNHRKSWINKLREAILCVRRSTLINLLRRGMREMKNCKTDIFKRALNKCAIPNEPQIPSYTANRRAESNSIHHMTSALRESTTIPTNSSQMEAVQQPWSNMNL